MSDEIQQAEELYDLIMSYLITYGFQVLAAIVILLIGIFIAGKIAGMLNKIMVSKEIDVTLSKFTANTLKIIVIVMVAIMALGQIGISVTPFRGRGYHHGAGCKWCSGRN
jgi:small conductance mechanosensitive channel